jgi:hypothetical protein
MKVIEDQKPASVEALDTSKNGDWLADYASEPDAVRSFCQTLGILTDLQAGIRLVETCFPSRKSLAVKLTQDPETDAEWVEIETFVYATIPEALDAYRRYIKEWVRAVSPNQRAKIRLAYYLA